MLDNCKTAQERWGGVNQIIDRWLLDRQQLLVSFCALSEREDSLSVAVSEQKLCHLCQVLVDYVSAGHFDIYDRLIKEGRKFENQAALKEASALFTSIDKTTGYVLDFNDKYLETDDLSSLDDDLSMLGATLEQRFNAEDRMIDVLHVAHKDLVN